MTLNLDELKKLECEPEAYAHGGDCDACNHRKKAFPELIAEVRRLREALEWYADEKNWHRNGPFDSEGTNYPVDKCYHYAARRALK